MDVHRFINKCFNEHPAFPSEVRRIEMLKLCKNTPKHFISSDSLTTPGLI